MKNIALVFACLFAGALAQIECPPPDEHSNATYFADPEDCHSYYECNNGLPVHQSCPPDLVWNQTLLACDFNWSTPCTTTPPPPPVQSFIQVQALPTCPPPDPTGHENVTFYPDESNCHKYYECDNGELVNRNCPNGMVWNPEKNVCDFDWAYPCNSARKVHKVHPKIMDFNEREIICPPPNPDGNYNATYYPDETDCHKYMECDNGVLKNLTCPDGLVWSQDLLACDFEWNTPCTTERRRHIVHPKRMDFNEREIICPPPNPDGNYNATYYPDETDCHKYMECDNGILKNLTCPDGLVWSQDLLACDFEWNTPCTTERRRHIAPRQHMAPRRHIAPAIPITSKAAGRKPVPYTEKSYKLRQKLRAMQRTRRHFIHKF